MPKKTAKALGSLAFRMIFAIGFIAGTVNPYFSFVTLYEQYAVAYPVGFALAAGVWFALGSVVFPLSRLRYNLLSTAILLASAFFALIYSGAPLTTLAWWRFEGAMIGGGALGWLMLSTFWWKYMRGLVGVDDADTGGE